MKSSRKDTILSRITFRNILTLAIGISIGIGGTVLTYSATAPRDPIGELVTLVNTQCNQDSACISDVASGLERAITTLREVVLSLRAQLANPPKTIQDPLPPTPPDEYAGSTSETSNPAGSTSTIGGGIVDTRVNPENPIVADLPRFPFATRESVLCPRTNTPEFYSSYHQCRFVGVKCNDSNTITTTNAGNFKDVKLDQVAAGVYNYLDYPQYLGTSPSDCQIAIEHANTLERAGIYR